jgi:hypothetical protein
VRWLVVCTPQWDRLSCPSERDMSRQNEFCMPLVVRQCLRERITGTLIVSQPEFAARKSLYVENGAVVFASSQNGNDLFGERLVRWGVITRAQLEDALARSGQTGEKLGRALVALSVLNPSDVRLGVQRLITERVAEVFDWTSAHILFEDNLPNKGEPAIATTPEMLLLRGVQHVGDTERVRRWLGDIEQVFVPIPDPFRFFDLVSLRPEEAFIISRLDQPITPREILTLGAFDEQLVLRVVCALRFAGVLEPAPNPTKKVFWLGDGVTFDQLVTRKSPHTPPAENGSNTPKPPEKPLIDPAEAARICFLVEEKIGAIADGADHYAILEVERRAQSDRIKSSYRELAKTFHPDRHAQLVGFDADIKDRLSRIFDALTRAYSTLSNSTERATYDAELQKREHDSGVKSPGASHSPPPSRPTAPPPRPAPQGTVPKPIVPSPPKPIVPPTPKTISPPPRTVVPPPKPIMSRQATPKPTPPPDHLKRPSSPSPNERSATRTTAAPSVYEKQTPSRSSERSGRGDSYPPVSKTPQGSQRSGPQIDITERFVPEPTAVELVARGDEFAANGDHSQAARAFRKASELEPDDAYIHLALGRSLAHMKGYLKEAEKALLRAIELDSTNARPLVALAKLYLSYGRRRDARELALRALAEDPDSVEAQDLVGSLPDRDPKPNEPKLPDEPGILRRLFKRETK